MPLMDALTGTSDHAIEDMFRRRGAWKARRRVLSMYAGLRSGSVADATRHKHAGGHNGTTIIAEIVDLDMRIQRADTCYHALTRQERLFVDTRYADGLSMRLVARSLGISEVSVYRLRRGVLDKCRAILGHKKTPASDE
jgi:DNA-directed RNA polymerase specialized sigma subunit